MPYLSQNPGSGEPKKGAAQTGDPHGGKNVKGREAACGGAQRNAAKIGFARHEPLHGAILHGGRFTSGNKRGRIRVQFLFVNIQ